MKIRDQYQSGPQHFGSLQEAKRQSPTPPIRIAANRLLYSIQARAFGRYSADQELELSVEWELRGSDKLFALRNSSVDHQTLPPSG